MPRHLRIFGLAAMLFVSGLVLQGLLSADTKDDWRGAVNQINSEAQAGDLVIMDAGFNRHVFDYYTNRSDLTVLDAPTFQGAFRSWLDQNNETFEGPGRAWHVRVYSGDTQQLVSQELSKNRTKTFSAQYRGVALHAWDVNESASASTQPDAGILGPSDPYDGGGGLLAPVRFGNRGPRGSI